MLNKFLNTVYSNNLFTKNDSLIIATSGGLDSSVLCELCHQAGFHFTIAHCNFQLRGAESERDEAFVHSLGKKYRSEVLVKKFQTEKYASDHKLSIQEAARALRYEWFYNLQPAPGIILTAHHQNDSIETMLMNFFRGTGLHGLTGIPIRNDRTRRPLLNFTRDELEGFAKKYELQWVEDSSNISSHYTRNYFRNELLPAVEKVFPQVKQNLAANLDRFREIEKLYKFATAGIKKKLLRQKGNEWLVPVKQLMLFNNRALIYELIADFGFNEKQVDEVLKLASSVSGRYIVSPDKQYRIILHRHWFIISPAASVDSANIIIDKGSGPVNYENGVLEMNEINELPGAITKDPSIALFNLSLINFPLLLRKCKTGDYFYPLGMKKKKKLSRFFIDQKLSKTEKEKVWVLENADGRIIWVVGMRIDDRFRVDEKPGKMLEIKLSAK